MIRSHRLSTLSILFASLLALAAHGQQSEEPETRSFVNVFVANPAPLVAAAGPVQIISTEGRVPGAVITGKPYSAESVTETIQTLADGNRITSTQRARVYRDSQGRTRLEQTLAAPGSGAEPVTIVTIDDPVAGTSYVLDTATKTTRVTRRLQLVTPGDAPQVGVAAGPADAGVIVSGGTAPVIVQRGGPAFTYGAFAGAPFGFGGEPVTEDLGEQVIEGVLARGTRQTRTIPAGAIGNERPIEIVFEQWYSEELGALMQRRTFDPRVGETIYRLHGVVRGEPPANLFEPPPEFELEALPELEPLAPGQRQRRQVLRVRPPEPAP